MTTRDWHDDDVSSATDPDAVLRAERIALANYDARMMRARLKPKAPGATSMRELMKRRADKNLLTKNYTLDKKSR